MKIEFPGGEHVEHPLRHGRVRIGSAADNEIALAAGHVRPHHVELHADPRRGVELLVMDGASDVAVNARPVREKAILRPGDVINLGALRMRLRPADARREQPPKADARAGESARQVPPRVVLRGLAGRLVGKIMTLRGRTVLGSAPDCDLVLDDTGMAPRHALIENTPDGLFLRDLGSAEGTWVNGILLRDAVLKPGDQIAFERNRFLIEAPGYLLNLGEEAPRDQVTSVQRPLQIPVPNEPQADPASAGGGVVDWIIMAAAVVTLVALGVLVYLQFGRGS